VIDPDEEKTTLHNTEVAGIQVMAKIVRSMLPLMGEDPEREGLKETPVRSAKAWKFLTSGYYQDPASVMKQFDAAGYQQLVLLKDVEIFSLCEHHLLPFVGRAHVAYIPDGKVLGVSKLARLVDIFAKRLQIQERIGEQVTSALMEHLKPTGAACIIEAAHLCMQMRGVEKQHSKMITSSLKGIFLEDTPGGHSARAELMQMVFSK
jgi:GTP cyclohydrolase I